MHAQSKSFRYLLGIIASLLILMDASVTLAQGTVYAVLINAGGFIMGPYGGLQFNVTAGNGLPCPAPNCQCYYAHTFPNVPLAAGQSIFLPFRPARPLVLSASAGSFGGVPGGAFCTWSGDTVLITIGSCPTNNDQADQPPCAGANGGCCGGGEYHHGKCLNPTSICGWKMSLWAISLRLDHAFRFS